MALEPATAFAAMKFGIDVATGAQHAPGAVNLVLTKKFWIDDFVFHDFPAVYI
jgi:hypothetical protein